MSRDSCKRWFNCTPTPLGQPNVSPQKQQYWGNGQPHHKMNAKGPRNVLSTTKGLLEHMCPPSPHVRCKVLVCKSIMTTLQVIFFVHLNTTALQKYGFVDTRAEMEGAAGPVFSPQRGGTSPETIQDYGGTSDTYIWR